MGRIIIVGLHCVAALAIVIWMYDHYRQRHDEVSLLVRREAAEQAMLGQGQRQRSILEARLEGLDAQHPYVVELIARERHGFHSPGEIRPPPLPDSE